MPILCATDFSPVAARALNVAAHWARRLGESLVVTHVVEPPMALPHEVAAGFGSWSEALSEAARRELARTAEGLRNHHVEVETKVLIGVPDVLLASYAAEIGARFLVLGTHGRTGAARFFLGSVAERAIGEAPCPVLVVPPHASEGYANGGFVPRPPKILVGLDASPASEAAVAWVRELRRTVSSNLTFLHVYWPPREHERLGIPGPFDERSDDPEVVAVLRRDLEPRLEDMPGQGGLSLRVRASWGRDPDPLALEAANEQADLLVVGTHQRHSVFAGSTALATVRASTVPVLCVPVKTARTATAKAPGLTPFRRVLAATDLSDRGNAAVTAAYRALRASGGVIELCHVADIGREPLPPERREAVAGELRKLIPATADAYGITTRVHVVEGGPAQVGILQAIERLGVDLVVLGTHGRTGFSRAVLGSVAEAVVRESPRPVVVVGPNAVADVTH